ncbi:hypothetical protein GCM10017557_44650 [Streptomyces aurantiacus]|uniref:Uncharacterized protein n=1 Tax=Streptomyces aurantiacus TaxID=47760 RepID=A0A7G1P6Z6_9ACTN|nr:hypothetical protein GCM10017557_44650 [Streptomyces aurantiacus]
MKAHRATNAYMTMSAHRIPDPYRTTGPDGDGPDSTVADGTRRWPGGAERGLRGPAFHWPDVRLAGPSLVEPPEKGVGAVDCHPADLPDFTPVSSHVSVARSLAVTP